jgi:hypothetical protein
MMEKKIALMEVLGCKYNDVSVEWENNYAAEGKEFIVLTEEEREEAVKEYIEQSVWAFSPSFLACETELPEEVFEALCEKCESGNDAILRLIEKTCGIEEFIESAVSADGHAHFLNTYDGTEDETEIEGEIYYIYRTN